MVFIAFLVSQSDIHAVDNFPIYAGRNAAAERLMQPYVDCALNAAEKLERSGEAADLVAKAAIDSCAKAKEELELEVDFGRVVAGLSGGDPLKVFDEWLTRQLSMHVVLKRAAAKPGP